MCNLFTSSLAGRSGDDCGRRSAVYPGNVQKAKLKRHDADNASCRILLTEEVIGLFEGEPSEAEQRAFTGDLPSASLTARTIAEAHRRYRGLDDGDIVDYIPVLAEADPSWFGLSLVDTGGEVHEAGDVEMTHELDGQRQRDHHIGTRDR